MKLLSTEQIREADRYTIEQEPVASVDLMERAATKCFTWLVANFPANRPFYVFCGPGNNGGDGLVIARLLARKRRKVEVFIVRFTDKASGDFVINFDRLTKNPQVSVHELSEGSTFPEIPANALVIDAIFGSGLNKPLGGWVGALVNHLNKAHAGIVSIDIPSGLFGEDNSKNEGPVIKARTTLTFQFPKLSFLFAENEQYTGNWVTLPIGLHPDFIAAEPSKNHLLEIDDCRKLVKPRPRFSHKGNYGHGLLISGSYGKMGAAVLAAHAALRAGVGLITAHIPSCGYDVMQTANPEVMVSIDHNEYCFSKLPDISPYNAIAVGPGLGTADESHLALKLLEQEAALPLIFDADALNILAANPTWLSFLTPNSILTPHPGEFDRIAGKCKSGWERWQKQKELSVKYQVYIILKGACTSITCPDGTTYFNSSGNPGMATAGSGDVLTGILLGLKAQGYNSAETCLLGVYLHGLAGDVAAKRLSQEAMIAGDIIEAMGKAWRYLSHS